MTYYKRQFFPRKPVRSFRDLEVYQKTLECSVLIAKNLRPVLAKLKYDFLENFINCAMAIPLFVAEAHSVRFASFNEGVNLLEKAMLSCNKMVVYLEQATGLYGKKLPVDLIEDLMRRYIEVRGKMFRLGKAWKRYRMEDTKERR